MSVINGIYITNNFPDRPEAEPLRASFTLETEEAHVALRDRSEAERITDARNWGRMAVPALVDLIPTKDPDLIRATSSSLGVYFSESLKPIFMSGVDDALANMEVGQAA